MELPVVTFIRQRIEETNPKFETRAGSVYHEMFIKPQQLMLQPLTNTLDQILVSQSIRRILLQDDPNAYPEEDVDDVVANVFVSRDTGAKARTTVRVYFDLPRDKEYPALSAEFTAGDLSFFNEIDVTITAQEMALNSDGELFFVDIPVVADAEGSIYNVVAGDITGFVNDLDAVRVTNISDALGGLSRENNVSLLLRAQNSIGVRDLETVKGINAILREKFPFLSKIQPIGMGDPEMQRDIVFNTHVGGNTDVYLKTPSLTTASKDFVGMDFDLTRSIDKQIRIQMARSAEDSELPAEIGSTKVVVGSVVVREDIIETPATITSVTIPPTTGINLVGKEFIKIKVDGGPEKRIKVSGATITSTQRFEIINSINAAVGFNVAFPIAGNKIQLRSTKIGEGSSIQFLATAPFTQAADAIFNVTIFPTTFTGIAAEVYEPIRDYDVDYVNGLIYQRPYDPNGITRPLPTILSGQTMIDQAADGRIASISGNFVFASSVPSRFFNSADMIQVRAGDEVTIHEISGLTTGTVIGDLPQTFIVREVLDTETLDLANFNPSGTTISNQVTYSIKSNQIVIVDYKFNPISIDIGSKVLLSDGVNRGVRPGRSAFTILDAPFIDIVSIQEVDPQSGEPLAEPLIPPNGFGYGGYGEGGYGIGAGGDYEYRILRPVDRFSVYDDGIIILKEDVVGRSFRVTYRWVPELVAIHELSRNDLERVTGADVLPKNFVPAFVDIAIVIRRDPTNINVPSNETLAVQVQEFVNTRSGSQGIQASDISKLLETAGVDSVKTPFVMTATVQNTDGTTTILESTDVLIFPNVTLEKQTDNFVTKRIVHFYPGNITVSEE